MKRQIVLLFSLIAVFSAAPAFSSMFNKPTAADLAIPRYAHIFNIIEENQAYARIMGNPDAPIVNRLAATYGSASNFYGEVHPSEGNYVALIGGSKPSVSMMMMRSTASLEAQINTVLTPPSLTT